MSRSGSRRIVSANSTRNFCRRTDSDRQNEIHDRVTVGNKAIQGPSSRVSRVSIIRKRSAAAGFGNRHIIESDKVKVRFRLKQLRMMSKGLRPKYEPSQALCTPAAPPLWRIGLVTSCSNKPRRGWREEGGQQAGDTKNDSRK